jgi:AraC-like DNA-binding protein
MSIVSTVVDKADIQFHAAPPAIKEHVGCFWIVTAEHSATMRLVPDGTTSIGVKLHSNGHFDGYLRGPLLKPTDLVIAPETTLIGVRLRPGVAYNLSSIAMHTLVDRRVHFRDCSSLDSLMSASPTPTTPLQWLTKLQDFLVARLAGTSVHPLVTRVLDQIHQSQGRISVADISASHEISERHLRRLLLDWVGFGAKRYASIVRYQSTLERMENSPQSASVLAADAGYFDQSHFNVDIARFTGDTPGKLLSERVSDFSKTHCDVPY